MTGNQFHLHDVARMPRAARPGIRKIRGRFHRTGHAAGARPRQLFARNVARGHDARAGGFRKNADRIVKVRRGAKPAMPPRIVKRVRENSFEACSRYVGGHLVTD